jgi:hypothetical protein
MLEHTLILGRSSSSPRLKVGEGVAQTRAPHRPFYYRISFLSRVAYLLATQMCLRALMTNTY